jgi:hypothetical protein
VKYGFVSPPKAEKQTFVPRLIEKRYIHLQLYKTDFGVSIAFGDGNTKISFLKARQRRAFKKPIFIMRITNASPFLLAKEKGAR